MLLISKQRGLRVRRAGYAEQPEACAGLCVSCPGAFSLLSLIGLDFPRCTSMGFARTPLGIGTVGLVVAAGFFEASPSLPIKCA